MKQPLRWICFAAVFGLNTLAGQAADYAPPEASKDLLKSIDFSGATALDMDYHRQFLRCDGLAAGGQGKDVFRGFALHGHYRCSTDPSRVKALLKLGNGAVLWESKMALDVDGSWAAWSGTKWKRPDGSIIETTDLCGTSMKWKAYSGKDCDHPEAQIDSDKFPFVVMPAAGLKTITGTRHKQIGREFAAVTNLKIGDMGVVVYGDKWSPVFIADGGPFMRLGEGSARLFENLEQTRCKMWDSSGQRCIGPGNAAYPYRNFGVNNKVVFILFPNSKVADFTPKNAISVICKLAAEKMQLTGGKMCPP
jgi:Fungal chitosanase of glycosyl hydrolase group 75